MADPVFSEVNTISVSPASPVGITVSTGTVWKIESAGVGGINGTVLLQDALNKPIAILYSSVDQNTYGSPLPFWLEEGFTGSFKNDSKFMACVSVTIYTI